MGTLAITIFPGGRPSAPYRHAESHQFTRCIQVEHLTAYEAACAAGDGGGGAYLREQGLYSSQITQWRQLRDAGMLAGRKPGEKIGSPSAEQAEIATLTRELELSRRQLPKTEAALQIMGKVHALLEEISESADTPNKPGRR